MQQKRSAACSKPKRVSPTVQLPEVHTTAYIGCFQCTDSKLPGRVLMTTTVAEPIPAQLAESSSNHEGHHAESVGYDRGLEGFAEPIELDSLCMNCHDNVGVGFGNDTLWRCGSGICVARCSRSLGHAVELPVVDIPFALRSWLAHI